jgi:hypothetical protein
MMRAARAHERHPLAELHHAIPLKHPGRPICAPAPGHSIAGQTDLAALRDVLTVSHVAAPSPATFSLDRSAFSVGRLQDDDSQVDYWLAQPAEQRLAALELLRESYNPDACAAQRLRGFLEVTQRA